MTFVPQQRTRSPALAPSFTQFLVLSLLVHLLVIVMFRQPAGILGGHGERALLSSLEVVLRESRPARDPTSQDAAAASLWRRWIGAPEPSTREPRRTDLLPREQAPSEPTPSVQPVPDAQPSPADAAAASTPRTEDTLPRIDPTAPTETDNSFVRSIEMPPPLPNRPLAPFELQPPRALERELPPAPPLAPAPALPSQPLPSVRTPAPRAIERELATVPEIAPAAPLPAQPLPRIDAPATHAIEHAAPAAPELPEAAPLPAQALPRVDLPATRALERELPRAPELAPAAPLPAQPLPRVDVPSPRTIEREFPRAPELAPAAPLPAQALPRIDIPSARAIERELPAAPELPPSVPLPTQPLPRVDLPAARAIEALPSLPLSIPRGLPSVEPAPRLFLPAPPLIEPKPAQAAPSGAPRFDFERAREVAQEFNRTSGRAVTGRPIDLNAPPIERASALGRAIQKAAQPDCRDAYAALGLLGLVPLIADTVMDRGCRW